MSSALTVTAILVSFLSLITSAHIDYDSAYDPYSTGEVTARPTREIQIRQGALRGTVVYATRSGVHPVRDLNLPRVDRFLGLPYAAPPTGPLRFMPPGTPPQWYGTKICDTLAPVCRQNLPVINKMKMSQARYKYMQRLLPYLKNQSEDCLYLNIYAPEYNSRDGPNKYPVIVYIHGESFEWNSGNPYDGSVLAAYGRVVVVTINFRLGILGFMKPGVAQNTPANFGLLDQIAALQWVHDNIAVFGGDPGSVTLMGHGTGAACVNFLMVSPVSQGADQGLFHRAILMSGTALADWALVTNPVPITAIVAHDVNCSPPSDHSDEMANCLRSKRIEELMNVTINGPAYTTKLGPVVDGAVIPNEPKQLMSVYKDLFSRYEVLYGVTELESYHLLDAVSLVAGVLEKDFEKELRWYLTARFEQFLQVTYIETLQRYVDIRNEGSRIPGTEHRDALLDLLSDARVVAPMSEMADLHSMANPKSYFYVFGHNSVYGDFAMMDKSISGEEIPFVFGVPLGGPKFHYIDSANKEEIFLSEQVMTFWTNFAKTGNPNAPRRFDFHTFPRNPTWKQYDIEWPEYDIHNQSYMNLGIPSVVSQHYRKPLMQFWNEKLPLAIKNSIKKSIEGPLPSNRFPHPLDRMPPPWIHPTPRRITSYNPITQSPIKYQYGQVLRYPPTSPMLSRDGPMGVLKVNMADVTPTPPGDVQASNTTMTVIITLGVLFLLVNILALGALFYKKSKLRNQEKNLKRQYDTAQNLDDSNDDNKQLKLESTDTSKGCNVIKLIKASTKSEGTYEAVKMDEKESQCSSKFSPKFKLTRQISTSTIDPHTKVRDWIAQEIVQRCSPRFLRKTRQNLSTEQKTTPQKEEIPKLATMQMNSIDKTNESTSTIEQSPTRPVSPNYAADSGNQSMKTTSTKLSKQSSIPVHKTGTGKKPKKVSVAIDATPAARSSSILKQEPIEITKCLEYSQQGLDKIDSSTRRSETMDNFLEPVSLNDINESINTQPTMLTIKHSHSKSDPVECTYKKSEKSGLYAYTSPQIPLKLKTFDSSKPIDINVTSREEPQARMLTPEEALQTIKRRNYPKVLPDLSDQEKCVLQSQLSQKRRSLPPPIHLISLPPSESPSPTPTSQGGQKNYSRIPPAPPPRTSSTLGRKPSNTTSITPLQSVSDLEKNDDQQVTSNIHVGPLLPKKESGLRKPSFSSTKEPIYDNLKGVHQTEKRVIAADGTHSIKKIEPKVIIKPTLSRKISDPNKNQKNIPRVQADETNPIYGGEINKSNSLPRQYSSKDEMMEMGLIPPNKTGSLPRQLSIDIADITEDSHKKPKSKLPKPCLNVKTSSDKSSDSSSSTIDSSSSDTGTVKRIN